jgi:YesN/AraC family two-component response regulator
MLKGKKVLVVDDAPITQNILKFFFKGMGIDLFEIASDGEEAIDKFRKQHHDLIIMDLRMPKMDGFQAIMKIKEESDKNKIIVLSGLDSEEARQNALEKGAEGFLLKPFNKKDLEEAISSIAINI